MAQDSTDMMNNSFIDEMLKLQDEHIQSMKAQTLQERIGTSKINLTNYEKHDGTKGRKTGEALLSNKIPGLCIVDIDINKSLDDERKERIRSELLEELSIDDVVVKTASGGLHVYCNEEYFTLTSNRMIKCFTSENFDVDIFGCHDQTKRSIVVLPGSRVRTNHNSSVTKYEFVRGSLDSCITRSVKDVLSSLSIKITTDQPDDIRAIIDESSNVSSISDEFAQALVDGLYELQIHNDGGSMPIDKEITLFTLFQAINSLPDRFINEAYENVRDACELTDKARDNFESARNRYSVMKTSPYVLARILKLWNPEYYNESIKPLLASNTKTIHAISFEDTFDLSCIIEKAEKKQYKHANEVITDLSRVIRIIDADTTMYVKKVWNVHTECSDMVFVNSTNMREMLRKIKLWRNPETKALVTVYDVMTENMTPLLIKGVRFNSTADKVMSIFHGFKYSVLDNFNMDIIEEFLKLIKEVIADSNLELYFYILNWISFIVQNPGVKTETALILKGLQGIGKNTFTDVLCEMMSGYSVSNITEISELTGNFNSVIESKMLLVLNELKNAGEDRLANFNALKSVITDKVIRINEKNQPRRTSENVANFIFCTNNSFPVKIEMGDRRYVVMSCNGVHKNDFDYWEALNKSFTPEFYAHLLTFFMKRDISKFNPRKIPMTEAKQDIIEASRSALDVWICDHYDELVKGLPCDEALVSKPSEMKERTFQLQLKDKCDRKRVQSSGVRKWHYVLKNECKAIYSQTVHDDVEEE